MDWKHIWSLTKLEFKHDKYHLLLLIGVYVFITYAILTSPPIRFEQGDFTIDFMFLFFFMTISFVFGRSKAFRYTKLQEEVWGVDFLVMLQQLPSPKKTIIMYRFVYHLIIIVPLQLVMLVSLLIFSPTLQQLLTISEYTVFIFIWLCISIFLHWFQTLYDFGTIQSVILWVERVFIMLVIIALFFILFYAIYKNGFFHWTIFLATTYPVLSVIISLLCTVFGTLVFIKRVERKIAQFDYF